MTDNPTSRPRVGVRWLNEAARVHHTPPDRPPAHWFARPPWLAYGQRLTIDPDGHLYGYLCPRTPFRLGDGALFTAPVSPSGYTRVMQGTVEVDTGALIRVAVIGAQGHHASVAHYTDPSTARAVVTVGDDDGGVWLSGALLSNATAADVATLRRSSLSGHWERGDLLGIAVVNQPAAQLGVHEADDMGGTPDGDGGHGDAVEHARRAGYAAAVNSLGSVGRALHTLDGELRGLENPPRLQADYMTNVRQVRRTLNGAVEDFALALLDAQAEHAVLPPPGPRSAAPRRRSTGLYAEFPTGGRRALYTTVR
jgi:hypothetical protein